MGYPLMSLHPEHDGPARDWINAGLAIPTNRGKSADFENMSFLESQANQLLYLA